MLIILSCEEWGGYIGAMLWGLYFNVSWESSSASIKYCIICFSTLTKLTIINRGNFLTDISKNMTVFPSGSLKKLWFFEPDAETSLSIIEKAI